MLGREFFRNIFGKPEWELPTEEEVMKNITQLKEQIEKLPKCSEKTKLIYTLANQMQILRIVLHDKKRKLRPNSKGKWVWVEDKKYEGRKYK